MRLQKLLANAGFGSRRQIDAWISEGRVEVDGRRASPGLKVTGREHIRIDGKPVRIESAPARVRVIAYHKPVGELCTRRDPQGRPTVFDALPKVRGGRWISVGRLDINSCGLLLLTTSGDLANELMHPSAEVARVYKVRVQGEVSTDNLRKLRGGIELDDGPAAFMKIDLGRQTGTNCWYTVEVREGRNRLVRRLFEAVGHRVNRLLRVRYGNFRLPRDLKPGHWSELSVAEVDALAVGKSGTPDQAD